MFAENVHYHDCMKDRMPSNKVTEHGKRLASLRKNAGFTQVEVAKELGIPQRNVSFYERAARQLPHYLVEQFAKLFGVTPEEILGLGKEEPRKRGPKTKLERLFEKAAKLPPGKQDLIEKILGEIIGNHA